MNIQIISADIYYVMTKLSSMNKKDSFVFFINFWDTGLFRSLKIPYLALLPNMGLIGNIFEVNLCIVS